MIEKSLTILGLSKLEAKAYMAIFNSGRITAREVAKLCLISRPRAYSILAKLEEKSLIISQGNRPKIYSCINPEQALKPVKEKKICELETVVDETIKRLSLAYGLKNNEAPSKTLLGFYIQDKNLSLKKLLKWIEKAHTEVVIFDAPSWILNHMSTSLQKARSRGVTVKLGFSDNNLIPLITRTLRGLKPKLLNSPTMVFQIDDKEYRAGYILVDRSDFANILHSNEKLILEGVTIPGCIECMLNVTSHAWEVTQKLTAPHGDEPREVLLAKEALMTKEGLSKRELSAMAGLSGSEVNQAIRHLMEKGLVEVREVRHGQGRPREEIWVKGDL